MSEKEKKNEVSCEGVLVPESKEWQKVGYADVDAGIMWLGDPCYILPDKRGDVINKEGMRYTAMLDSMYDAEEKIYVEISDEDIKKLAESILSESAEGHEAFLARGYLEHGIGKEMYKKQLTPRPDAYVFNHSAENPGRGVLVNSGLGDGTYPVYIKTAEVPGWGKRVTEMKVVFIEEKDDEEDE